MTEWWTVQDAALIGAIGGSLGGLLGGTLGPAIGVCAPKGIARGPVLGAVYAIVALGMVVLVTGLVAVSTGQPYHVWFPLVLIGGLPALIFGALIPVARLRYAQAEARKLDAEALRRG